MTQPSNPADRTEPPRDLSLLLRWDVDIPDEFVPITPTPTEQAALRAAWATCVTDEPQPADLNTLSAVRDAVLDRFNAPIPDGETRRPWAYETRDLYSSGDGRVWWAPEVVLDADVAEMAAAAVPGADVVRRILGVIASDAPRVIHSVLGTAGSAYLVDFTDPESSDWGTVRMLIPIHLPLAQAQFTEMAEKLFTALEERIHALFQLYSSPALSTNPFLTPTLPTRTGTTRGAVAWISDGVDLEEVGLLPMAVVDWFARVNTETVFGDKDLVQYADWVLQGGPVLSESVGGWAIDPGRVLFFEAANYPGQPHRDVARVLTIKSSGWASAARPDGQVELVAKAVAWFAKVNQGSVVGWREDTPTGPEIRVLMAVHPRLGAPVSGDSLVGVAIQGLASTLRIACGAPQEGEDRGLAAEFLPMLTAGRSRLVAVDDHPLGRRARVVATLPDPEVTVALAEQLTALANDRDAHAEADAEIDRLTEALPLGARSAVREEADYVAARWNRY